MNDDKAKAIWNTLYSKSKNTNKVKSRIVTTPESNDRSEISEIDLCYNAEYDNWFIKTFWGSKKAYRYTIRYSDLNEWIEFLEWCCDNNNDELFS